MATIKKLYSDLDLTFRRLPVSNDVALSYDEQAVIRSVRNLLLTNFYERLFQPTLGSNIDTLLFEPITVLTAGLIKAEIRNVINNFEPRVSIQDIVVDPAPDKNAFKVTLSFFIGNNTLPTAFNLLLERSR
jgi:phage baseplate assembly protein W